MDWDEPSDGAVNIGEGPYEGITVFFLAHPEDVRFSTAARRLTDAEPVGRFTPELTH